MFCGTLGFRWTPDEVHWRRYYSVDMNINFQTEKKLIKDANTLVKFNMHD